jgi:hypothetical protein
MEYHELPLRAAEWILMRESYFAQLLQASDPVASPGISLS